MGKLFLSGFLAISRLKDYIEEEAEVRSKFPLKRLVDLWRTQWRVAGSDPLWFAFSLSSLPGFAQETGFGLIPSNVNTYIWPLPGSGTRMPLSSPQPRETSCARPTLARCSVTMGMTSGRLQGMFSSQPRALRSWRSAPPCRASRSDRGQTVPWRRRWR